MTASHISSSMITPASSLATIQELLSTSDGVAALSNEDLLLASEVAHLNGCAALAVVAMKALVQRAPEVPLWHSRLANVLLSMGDSTEAERHCRIGLQLSPNLVECYHALRHILFHREDFVGALQVALAQEQNCGADAGLTLQIAELQFRLGRFGDALATTRQLNDNGLATEHSLLLEAEMAYLLGSLRNATTAVERAARIWPTSVAALSKLGALLLELDEHVTAASVLDRARQLAPESAALAHLHSVALVSSGQLRAAADAIVRAIALNPAVSEYHHIAAVLFHRLGQLDDAISHVRSAIDLSPSRADLHVTLAHLLNNAGDMRGAIAALDSARSLSPDDREVRNLSIAFRAQGARHVSETNSISDELPPKMPSARRKSRGDRASEDFIARLRGQVRVLSALVLREFRYRAIHSRFGILSVMVPQAIQIVTLGVVLSLFNNGRPPVGDYLFFFYATGVMPFYMFIHVIDHSQNQFLDNLNVLQIPIISRIDVVLGMALAELLINSATVVITFGSFALLSYGPSSGNHIEAVYAMLAVWLFAFGVGLISAVINNLYRPWANGWMIVQRFLYIASGVFYIPQQMPDWIRDVLVWNPILQGIEWFRTGFFYGYDPPWLDKSYLLGVAFATVIVGMMLERIMRSRMKTQ